MVTEVAKGVLFCRGCGTRFRMVPEEKYNRLAKIINARKGLKLSRQELVGLEIRKNV